MYIAINLLPNMTVTGGGRRRRGRRAYHGENVRHSLPLYHHHSEPGSQERWRYWRCLEETQHLGTLVSFYDLFVKL